MAYKCQNSIRKNANVLRNQQKSMKTAQNYTERKNPGVSITDASQVPEWVTESNVPPQELQGGPIEAARVGCHPVFGRWYRNNSGYPVMTGGPHRKKLLHRLVWEEIAGRKVQEGYQIHHMNGKGCTCGWNLVELPAMLHPHPIRRDPYTGEFLSKDEYRRRYQDDYY